MIDLIVKHAKLVTQFAIENLFISRHVFAHVAVQ